MSDPTQPNDVSAVDHGDRGHAEFGPSGLKPVALCPAYHGKDGTSEAAEKGTRIHEALEVRDPSALHDEEEEEIYDECVRMEEETLVDFMTDNGITMKDDYFDHNENTLDMDLTLTETFGTCDRLRVWPKKGLALMGDYKTGISIIDPVAGNYQAKAYVIGAMQKFPYIERMEFAFYVPLHNSVLRGTFHRSDLRALMRDVGRVIIEGERVRPLWENGGQPELADCRPNTNCRFCRHEERCPAMGALILDVARRCSTGIPESIDFNNTEDPGVMEELFGLAKIVEKWSAATKKRCVAAAVEHSEADPDTPFFPNLRLRSMGQTTKINDSAAFAGLAVREGVDLVELMEAAGTVSLAKARKVVPDNVIDLADTNGLLDTGAPRWTLK